MAKPTATSEFKERPYKTTGVHLPAELWELLNRVAFERARRRGGRASVTANQFRKNAKKAGMRPSQAELGWYRQTYAWVMAKPEKLKIPVPYEHPL